MISESFDFFAQNSFLGIMVMSDPDFTDAGRCPQSRSITRDPSRPPKLTDSLPKIDFQQALRILGTDFGPCGAGCALVT